MAQFQAYNKLLISQNEEIQNFRVGDYILGYVIHCQYPSYRGTFLSCIEEMKVYVDGEEIQKNHIYFSLNGKQFLMEQFKDLYQEYWFILDKAKLLILKDGGLEMNSKHQIAISIRHKIPYTGYFGSYMVLSGENKKELVVKGERETL